MADDELRLDGVRGFVFDVDGTLLHRGPDGRGRPQPGAVEVLDRIRATGRKLVLFTNGSHVPSARIAHGLRQDGLPVADQELLTPVDSAITYLRRRHAGAPVLAFASESVCRHMAEHGIPIARDEDAEVVFVAHLDEVEMAMLDRAARAVVAGAPLFTGSYVRGYAGANGMIFSRGAMITAAIAKVTGARPRVLGKPSRAAVAEVGTRLGMPTQEVAVIGDDLGMDIALGRMGGSRTVLVRSGISGAIDLDRVPERRRPDAVIDGVADLLEAL
ncbi:MAG TPA: HAD hydrolase-like protein [Solirubrobacteraceae bacterium]